MGSPLPPLYTFMVLLRSIMNSSLSSFRMYRVPASQLVISIHSLISFSSSLEYFFSAVRLTAISSMRLRSGVIFNSVSSLNVFKSGYSKKLILSKNW